MTTDPLNARILLNETSHWTEWDGGRTRSVWEHTETRTSVGRTQLRKFVEHQLDSRGRISISCPDHCLILIVPVSGGVEIGVGLGEISHVAAGEIYHCITSQEPVSVHNPFSRAVRLLEIQFSCDPTVLKRTAHSVVEVNLALNQLMDCIQFTQGTSSILLELGQFTGRRKVDILFSDGPRYQFVYVVKGAFEVEDRLLEIGDALQIDSLHGLSFEALSNHAILLVLSVRALG